MKRESSAVTLLLSGLLLVVSLVGCGGGKNRAAFYTVSERGAYGADGSVVFTFFGGNALRYLGLIDEDGGTVTTLTPSSDDPDLSDEGGWHPAISPDGTKVAMTSKRHHAGQFTSNDLYVIPLSGGETSGLTRLTTHRGDDDMASWSPDGARIVFVSDRDGQSNLYVMNADGSGQAPLLTENSDDEWPCFNPKDANLVAFSSDRAGPKDGKHTDLFILNTATKAVTPVTHGPLRNEAPAWSPDGARLLFHSNRGGDFDLFSVRTNGTGLVQLTADAHSDGFPAWRPDGLRFVFTRDRQVWTATQNGSDLNQLTRTF